MYSILALSDPTDYNYIKNTFIVNTLKNNLSTDIIKLIIEFKGLEYSFELFDIEKQLIRLKLEKYLNENIINLIISYLEIKFTYVYSFADPKYR